jgi:hypothetical protein
MPIYFAKTSGTTSGAKYIPITSDSIGNHVGSATLAALNYSDKTNKWKFLDHKMIFLSGSPELDMSGAVKTGRLSGIVNHHVPGWLRLNQLPSYKTNCIENWEEKLDAIIAETLQNRMGLISGIPPWVQMYFDKLQAKTGKQIKDIFPDFQLFMYGGVNFKPYEKKLYDSIGKKITVVKNVSEGLGLTNVKADQIRAEEIKAKYDRYPINTEDGVKINFEKEWVHLRKSNTEPIIRIYAESELETTASNLADKIIRDIKELISQ